jgi:hypothetical protein
MKTNEYRIGNYVSRDGNIMKVVAINERALSLELVDKATGQQTNSGRTVPILLSEEWLVRLGFKEKKDDDGFFGYEKDGFWFMNEQQIRMKYGSFVLLDIKLKHVHKLQNLHYALKDKEITL